MTTATRTRKPRNTAASLISSEFTKYQVLSDGSIWAETKLPEPIKQHPASLPETQPTSVTANPLLLALIAFVAVMGLVKAAIGVALIAVKLAKKIAPKVQAFVAAQLGGEKIDFRVYQGIFD